MLSSPSSPFLSTKVRICSSLSGSSLCLPACFTSSMEKCLRLASSSRATFCSNWDPARSSNVQLSSLAFSLLEDTLASSFSAHAHCTPSRFWRTTYKEEDNASLHSPFPREGHYMRLAQRDSERAGGVG